MALASLQARFQLLKCVVMIPTYNNERTLTRVIDAVLRYTTNVIIVNDGSTDNTANLLKDYDFLTQIHLFKNKGKGFALRQAFHKAEELGYEYGISIDSDGQHFAEDLPIFLEELEKEPNKEILLIGSRTMTGPEIPSKSSFGNKFSNFWFWIETGTKLTDTQCGYRLYPLQQINKMYLFTNKFEFEIEVIVKAAWRHIEVKNVPVQVLYDPSERVSHFRPFQDFTRISILNTFLVAATLVYYLPKRSFHELKNTNRKELYQIWREKILKVNEPPHKKALAISLGIFIGIAPFWGFHTLLVLFLAQITQLNKVLAFLASNISFPPFIPFIIYLSYQTGGFILGNELDTGLEIFEIKNALDMVNGMKQYVIGAFVLATASSLLVGIVFYFIFSIRQNKQAAKA
ncbi:DUF2062 domain-containing protein [Mesonia ostreae]|uniref:DUF2062 domain-containing protein n=1 Tax=Mesonia ostreae TaxID=861110 RepID=A0ABU2KI36_9FLAO|nr:DUF2062 domain-containing protein [Mesonia ostreae]MDT0294373.1 DUF2062 domain-containing protein [Mesonia ostreae]